MAGPKEMTDDGPVYSFGRICLLDSSAKIVAASALAASGGKWSKRAIAA